MLLQGEEKLSSLNPEAQASWRTVIEAIPAGIYVTSGLRSNSKDHSTGRAVDMQPAANARDRDANIALATTVNEVAKQKGYFVRAEVHTNRVNGVRGPGWHVHAIMLPSSEKDTASNGKSPYVRILEIQPTGKWITTGIVRGSPTLGDDKSINAAGRADPYQINSDGTLRAPSPLPNLSGVVPKSFAVAGERAPEALRDGKPVDVSDRVKILNTAADGNPRQLARLLSRANKAEPAKPPIERVARNAYDRMQLTALQTYLQSGARPGQEWIRENSVSAMLLSAYDDYRRSMNTADGVDMDVPERTYLTPIARQDVILSGYPRWGGCISVGPIAFGAAIAVQLWRYAPVYFPPQQAVRLAEIGIGASVELLFVMSDEGLDGGTDTGVVTSDYALFAAVAQRAKATRASDTRLWSPGTPGTTMDTAIAPIAVGYKNVGG